MNIFVAMWLVSFGIGSYCAVNSWSALRQRYFPVAIVAGATAFVFLGVDALMLMVWSHPPQK
jgi:membrane-bound acyltransferase YfiQ involved in biofilm formation